MRLEWASKIEHFSLVPSSDGWRTKSDLVFRTILPASRASTRYVIPAGTRVEGTDARRAMAGLVFRRVMELRQDGHAARAAYNAALRALGAEPSAWDLICERVWRILGGVL